MFDGNHRPSRREVNLSGKRKNATKQTLLEQSRVRREERRIANQRASAATRVQCRHRGNIDRRRLLEAWSHQVRQGFTSSSSSNPSTSAADSVTRVLEALFRLASVAPAWQGTVTQLLPDYAKYLITTTRNKALLSSGSDPPLNALHMVVATLREAKADHLLGFEDICVILTYLLKINSLDSDDDKGSTTMGVRVFQPMIELLCEPESSNHHQYHHFQSPLRPFLRQCIAKSLPTGTQKDAVTLVLGLAFQDVSSSWLPQHWETLRNILADHIQLSNKYPLLFTILASRHSVKILVEAAELFLQHPTLASGSCWLWLFQFSQREMSTGFNPIDQSLVLWAMNRLARGDSLQTIVDTDTTMKDQKELDDFDSDYYDDDYDDENDGLVTKISLQRDVGSSSLLTSPRRADRQELSTIAKLDRHFLSLTRKADEWYAGHSSGLQPGVENLANPQLWHQLGILILSQGSEKEKSNYIIILFIILQSLSSAAINRSSLSSQLLNKLSFSLEFIERLWAFLETKMKSRADPHTWSSDFISALAIFATIFSHYLVALRDEQFIARHTNLHTPLSATEKRSVPVWCVIDIYKEILGHLYLEAPVCQSDFQLVFAKHDVIVSGLSTRTTSGNDTELAAVRAQLILTGTKLFQSLHNRWTRLVVTAPFCDENVWWIDAVVKTGILSNDTNDMVVDDKQSDLADSFRDPKVARLLSAIPMVLPFNQRVELFQSLLKHEKAESQNSMEEAARVIEAMIRGEEPRRSAQIEIHRDRLFEDSMDQLNALGKRMKQKIQVSFVNRHGAAEAGIDGGGVFREFIDDLIHEAFLEVGSDHRPKLFTVTPNQTLMINTDVAVNEHNLARFEFLGRVLGKALYESILVEPQFCLPFLNQLLGKSNSLDDLKNLDAEYYNNLIKLLAMSIDDLEGLGLCFEASVGNISARSVELVPNGRNIPVNKQNVISYVHLVANMKLNAEPSRQTKAFLRGFQDLISSTWVRLFSAHELQKLISGDDSLRGFDVEALKRSMHYAAGYHPDQQIIQWFWEVLEEFSTEQKHLFLKFMTSCSRQPLLGFGSLEPAPCVQQIRLPDSLFQEGNLDRLAKESPLPTSSTCMNLLKLPNYRSKELLKHKLLAAIESGSGFELT